MELLKIFAENFISLTNAMSLYLLLGLILAGILKELLPQHLIFKELGKKDFKSIFKATLIGIPLPVCSCSVIPLAKSLQKEGASVGAVQSFLISAPITGVDSILATYGFFGFFFTLYRVVTSIIIALVAGVLQNLFTSSSPSFSLNPPSKFSLKPCTFTPKSFTKTAFSLKRALSYSFNTLLKDIYKPLFIGLLLGALFATFLPKELLFFKENLLLSYLLILLISLPLYVCATSSLPIAISLLSSGISWGGVFIFLTAGPATNAVTIAVLKQMYGKRVVGIYLAVVAILSLLFALLLDLYFQPSTFKVLQTSHEHFTLFHSLSSGILLGLIGYYWIREHFRR